MYVTLLITSCDDGDYTHYVDSYDDLEDLREDLVEDNWTQKVVVYDIHDSPEDLSKWEKVEFEWTPTAHNKPIN